MIEASGAGRVVPPDDPASFVAAVRDLLADPGRLVAQGAAGRTCVEHEASPQAVAMAYAVADPRAGLTVPTVRRDQPVASHPRGYVLIVLRAKKVAKLAQRGKGKKVRFQGGTLFPAVVLGVVIVGLLTIVYAAREPARSRVRSRRRSTTTGTPPTACTCATGGCPS